MKEFSTALTEFWKRNSKKIRSEDILEFEKVIGTALPDDLSYILKTYGAVSLGLDAKETCCFRFGDNKQSQITSLTMLLDPKKMTAIYSERTNVEHKENATVSFPDHYIPIGLSDLPGFLLMDFKEEVGRIFFWPENDHPWGDKQNQQVFSVAENIFQFIDKLTPKEGSLKKIEDLSDLRDSFISGGSSIADMMYLAGIINDGHLFEIADLERVREVFLLHENPQVRRLGLNALQRHVPKHALTLRNIFMEFLDDSYSWCRFDVVKGLSKMALFVDDELYTKLHAVVQSSENEKTKKIAGELFAEIENLRNLKIRQITNESLGIKYDLPEGWIEVKDGISDLIPFSYQSPLHKLITLKCAKVRRHESIKDVEQVIELNLKNYSHIWTVHRKWKLDKVKGYALLLTQEDISYYIDRLVSLEMVKVIFLTANHIFYLSYQFPTGSEFVNRDLMIRLAEGISLND